MAAITPDSIQRESMGSLTLHIATFHTTTIDNADTWESDIPGIVASWSTITTAQTSASSTALAISTSNLGTGQLTFTTGVVNVPGIIYVISQS